MTHAIPTCADCGHAHGATPCPYEQPPTCPCDACAAERGEPLKHASWMPGSTLGSGRWFVPGPPKPADVARNYADFAKAIHDHKPKAAKAVGEGNGQRVLLVYLDGPRNIYVRETRLVREALGRHGVSP